MEGVQECPSIKVESQGWLSVGIGSKFGGHLNNLRTVGLALKPPRRHLVMGGLA